MGGAAMHDSGLATDTTQDGSQGSAERPSMILEFEDLSILEKQTDSTSRLTHVGSGSEFRCSSQQSSTSRGDTESESGREQNKKKKKHKNKDKDKDEKAHKKSKHKKHRES